MLEGRQHGGTALLNHISVKMPKLLIEPTESAKEFPVDN